MKLCAELLLDYDFIFDSASYWFQFGLYPDQSCSKMSVIATVNVQMSAYAHGYGRQSKTRAEAYYVLVNPTASPPPSNVDH
jgi:hypothetical protein